MAKTRSRIRFQATLLRPAPTGKIVSWAFATLPKGASAKLLSRPGRAPSGRTSQPPRVGTGSTRLIPPNGPRRACVASTAPARCSRPDTGARAASIGPGSIVGASVPPKLRLLPNHPEAEHEQSLLDFRLPHDP